MRHNLLGTVRRYIIRRGRSTLQSFLTSLLLILWHHLRSRLHPYLHLVLLLTSGLLFDFQFFIASLARVLVVDRILSAQRR